MGETRKTGGKILVYLQCYFVTIATILGTGILGLPVTLSKSGIYPFLASFLFGALMQMLTVYFFTELLQLAHVSQIQDSKEELVPLNDLLADETCDELEEEDETSDSQAVVVCTGRSCDLTKTDQRPTPKPPSPWRAVPQLWTCACL